MLLLEGSTRLNVLRRTFNVLVSLLFYVWIFISDMWNPFWLQGFQSSWRFLVCVCVALTSKNPSPPHQWCWFMGEPFHVQGVSASFHPFRHAIGLHQSLRPFYGASITTCSYAVCFLRPKTADLADGPDIPSVNSPTKMVGIKNRIQQIPASEKK